jgi:pyruvate/2-oxoglutarate dehydrogenase complex dihydrolipoamide acyltransferase (E2) component
VSTGSDTCDRPSRHRDSPRVRRLARDFGVDLSAVRPTGSQGRATAADVRGAARGFCSQHGTAQVTTVVEVDLTGVVHARFTAKEESGGAHGVPLTVIAFVAEAAVFALLQHPRVNAAWGTGAGTEPTFTITRTGDGVLFDTPIIEAPQSAALGLGAIVRRPVVVMRDDEEQLAIRSMAFLALTYDPRLVDRADAGRYLGTVRARLETQSAGLVARG